MKLLWLLTVVRCLTASATLLSTASNNPVSTCAVLDTLCENGCTIPQLSGSYECANSTNCQSLFGAAKKVCQNLTTTVLFCLNTPSNPSECQVITADTSSVDSSNFDPSMPVRVYIHGYTQCYYSDVNRNISTAYFNLGGYNVIHVIWCGACADYYTSACLVSKVAAEVCVLIKFFYTNYNVSDLHVIGHSLGAHVAGFTGKCVKISRLFGLDPAGPLFDYGNPSGRLSITDASVLIVIHTNCGIFGMVENIGDIDFFINGGNCQPDCPFSDLGICSHLCANSYFIALLRGVGFFAKQCNNYQDARSASCSGPAAVNVGDVVRSVVDVNGIYYVAVDATQKYCQAYIYASFLNLCSAGSSSLNSVLFNDNNSLL